MVQNVAWNQYVLLYFWLFTGTECCLESVCFIVLLTVYWYRMLPGISMYYFTFDSSLFDGTECCLESVCIILIFECLMVQNVAWNQYVLFYFWVFDGTECCLESVCIILIFECLMVQNVAWNQYVLFYFWVFDGTECCLQSVCIVLLLSVWWYRMLPGISMYYFTFECLLVQNVAWNQYVICIILLLTHHCLMVENVAWNQYVLLYLLLFTGTECCLESVCIILLLSVWWYRMLPGISMYYFNFECLLVQNVAWNQYVLLYFWLFTGTECCLEYVCIILLLTVWW